MSEADTVQLLRLGAASIFPIAAPLVHSGAGAAPTSAAASTGGTVVIVVLVIVALLVLLYYVGCSSEARRVGEC